jgi:rhodanese-related sulfurtransferase
MKKKNLVFIIALLIGVAFAFNAPVALAKDMTKTDLVKEAKSKVTQIAPAEAKAQLDKGGAVFLDCREPSEYEAGHIPGAMNIPRGMLEFKIAEKIPDKNTRILMYCKTGGRASLSCCSIDQMGYKNVVSIDGGWKAWEKAKYPVEK